MIRLLSQFKGVGAWRVLKQGLASSAARSRMNFRVGLVELCRVTTPPAKPALPNIKNRLREKLLAILPDWIIDRKGIAPQVKRK